MKKLTFLAILTYMFCFSYGCTGIDDATWRQHLMEEERLLDRAPTFLEVNGKKDNGKNMNERSNRVWKDPDRTCGWNPYDCFKKKRESSK